MATLTPGQQSGSSSLWPMAGPSMSLLPAMTVRPWGYDLAHLAVPVFLR
jgi:hypothetical protein